MNKRQPVEVTATTDGYLSEKYRNGDFAIINVQTVPGTANADDAPPRFAIKGDIEPLDEGVEYRFYGYWQTDPRYGQQLRVETYKRAVPHGEAGVIKYLVLAPNVGNAVAKSIWDHFGSNGVRHLRDDPDGTADTIDVRGFTIVKAREAALFLRDQKATEDLEIELLDLFSAHGIPKSVIKRCMRRFGNLAADRIKHDPFLLMPFRGVSWQKADAMYMSLGLPPGRLKRQVYFMLHLISEDREGHTWIDLDSVMRKMAAKIGREYCRPDKALELGRRARKLSVAKTRD